MTGRTKKTDNHSPGAKLDLRRYFLRKYHARPANVLDCCQGSGVLWKKLRQEFPLAGYMGVDLKPKKGRLKIDSSRILAQPGWPQDVIDVDTYGNPWKHWFALLDHCVRPLTVFLTWGSVANGPGSKASDEELDALGMRPLKGNLPASFTLKIIRPLSFSYCLHVCSRYKLSLVEAVEAASDGNARYVGVRLEPKENGQAVHAACPPTTEE